ncbi:MAG: helix-turn-helix domain-containing protein [Azoarcus sp.]|jgi:hypothetical protein|nr:helix-turn-helix domain-containing protein [Azoarcus sp.]
MKADIEKIKSLGGTSKLAKLLGYTPQRVSNWKRRGIPAQVKLEHQEMFLAPPRPSSTEEAP